MLPIRTILHPTDFSDCSEYARQLARSLARDYGARIVVVHVPQREIVHPGLIGGPGEAKPFLDEVEARLRESFEKDLDTRAEIVVREGEPASTILWLADEVHADLIVMGTTGRSGLGRLLLGSVAEEVMRRAHCPVLGPRTGRDRRPARFLARGHGSMTDPRSAR
jgi:nucleotide-binding universal stress UspA family protein